MALSLALALTLTMAPVAAHADAPAPDKVASLPGKPVLMLSSYDLAALGYQVDEFTAAGRASRYDLLRPATSQGNLAATVDGTAPYATRYVVIRPSDPAKFNGTVLVEWLNVTSGQDAPADWMVGHREMLRRGYAYVAVSAQLIGVEGGNSVMGMGSSLKKLNPQRYAGLSHPGDAFSFDIFSQAGQAVKARGASGMLGPLVPRRVLAIGESQSAVFLTTYIDAVDPLARTFDGFLVHSRFGSGAALNGVNLRAPVAGNRLAMPPQLRFRQNLRVPVLTLITETDLNGANLTGYYGSRQPEGRNLRVWELAGSAHADGYLFTGAFADNGQRSAADMAKVFVPSTNAPGGKLAYPYNPGLPHHYVLQAAIRALDGWVRSGKAPQQRAPIAVVEKAGKAEFVLDANGNARGGVRTPWTDVPTMRLSGVGNSGSFVAMLAGVGEPLEAARLAALYPGGKADYLRRFSAALDGAIRRGDILPEDRREILDIAAINYHGAP